MIIRDVLHIVRGASWDLLEASSMCPQRFRGRRASGNDHTGPPEFLHVSKKLLNVGKKTSLLHQKTSPRHLGMNVLRPYKCWKIEKHPDISIPNPPRRLRRLRRLRRRASGASGAPRRGRPLGAAAPRSGRRPRSGRAAAAEARRRRRRRLGGFRREVSGCFLMLRRLYGRRTFISRCRGDVF